MWTRRDLSFWWIGSGLPVFVACLKFNHVNEFHQKKKKKGVPEGFLKNSNKYYPKIFRDPGLAYISLYLLKI